ncbi:bifunctional 2-polyprenyl-6-hydroxyphenol methylase/3-demethylubiquinol 3-O-methyltransferase UbiG [Arcobacter sp. CECT 8985]|uniref:class I SAM-dependent methyltransferase n=1 Tax=Arcobacter sp. CECT 8985 TaxID=1935424 RepID=UPI00100C12DA|nr:class I SAM-dependent methyltransferase [Arcobacter sp. CECT 8985]RXJ87880.1 methyltransferase [Arcobacter sp. CECT 8985]
MQDFSNKSMFEIYNILYKQLKKKEEISFYALNPDIKDGVYAGEKLIICDQEFIYRSLYSFIDLASLLDCKMLMPEYIDDKLIKINFKKLNKKQSFHKDSNTEEKYGSMSYFSKINKNEEPDFLLNYINCLTNAKIEKRKRVLNLGVNSGGEFEVIKNLSENFSNLELVGIDYSKSAIKLAKSKFYEHKNVSFYSWDINRLDELDLGQFDLIVSIGTLQSTNLNFNETFMNIVQKYLKKDGAMILGFPNCRWYDGSMVYGAVAKNYSYSEMSVLYKDAMFCKKYLQQKKFRVTLTGKNYIFLTATSIRK